VSARWPAYPVTVVGSWPRPEWLLQARKRRDPELAALEDRAAREAIRAQEDAGVDIVSDGEQRRDNFYSFLCDRLEGMRLMTMADLLDHVEDKAGFEAMLQALDVPAWAIKNPTVVGRLAARRPLVLEDLRFLREHTRRPVKVTLPGPYLLSRSTWVKSLSEGAYPTRESLADDIVRLLRDELRALAAEGAEVVQFDEPVLTELVFAGKSATRTFMCAALAARSSPEEELELAVSLMNRVVEGVSGPITALHVCRGNWSQNEGVLLEGPYDALVPHLRRIRVRQFVLEYATPRAGSLEALRALPDDAQVGLGVVNPRTSEVEEPAAIVARVREAERHVGRERLFLNPDCGFATFADRAVATADVAARKLRALAAAAAELRK
jgi:5-methyltetrahydropteroyltriglutamate--homocysteine methyltransferase